MCKPEEQLDPRKELFQTEWIPFPLPEKQIPKSLVRHFFNSLDNVIKISLTHFSSMFHVYTVSFLQELHNSDLGLIIFNNSAKATLTFSKAILNFCGENQSQ